VHHTLLCTVSWRRSGGNLLREDLSIIKGVGVAAKTDQVYAHRVRPGLCIMAALTTTYEAMWFIWCAYGIAVDLP